MIDYKTTYDIFICGGSQHVPELRMQLPKLHPFGRVHLASITLTDPEVEELRPHFDVLHRPRHDPSGYENFEQFCIRDINRLASAPHFIKLDCDTLLADDWVQYVDRSLRSHPDSVLFGPRLGMSWINIELAGELVRRQLGGDVRAANGRKLLGGFYVGQTKFFKAHERFMRSAHEFLYCFRDGRRFRPSLCPEEWDDDEVAYEPITSNYGAWGTCGEDHLRSFVVHASGAGRHLHCLDAAGRVVIVVRGDPPAPVCGAGRTVSGAH
jgi:hypothetical protein